MFGSSNHVITLNFKVTELQMENLVRKCFVLFSKFRMVREVFPETKKNILEIGILRTLTNLVVRGNTCPK